MNASTTRQFWLVAVCFLLSGFAALLYETVWLRQFAILLGTSEQALAVVLASYMGGLAVGAWVASRLVGSIRRPLFVYGLLELGIAVAALLVPVGISVASMIQVALIGGQSELPDSGGMLQVVFCFGTAFGLILIPTALMGATLPLLASHVVKEDSELGPKIGLLYAINTAGAVLGTLTAAFYCLSAFGLGGTTWVGASINLLVFAIVILIVRTASTDGVAARPATQGKQTRQASGKKNVESEETEGRYDWILLLIAASGAVSFCCEIVFTRMIGQMLGGSVYAFATMLAGFLLGIALGGAVASRLATDRRASAVWFSYTQVGAGLCTLVAYNVIDRMVLWSWAPRTGALVPTAQIFVAMVVLIPTATMIGATLPLAIRIKARDESEAATASARVYFWNVLGGIIGAMATGAFVLPLGQFHGTVAFAIAMNFVIAAGAIFLLRLKPVHWVLPGIALAFLIVRLPAAPENILRVSALTGQVSKGEILFNHVGKSATVTVFRDRGEILFQTNGLPEARLAMLGDGDIHRTTGYWLSALPSMVRPTCRSMLIVGLGGGVVAELVPPSIETIDVVEIEPAVLEANRAVSMDRSHDPLKDPRTRIIINDGRNALALSDKKYDVIVSQPSHPWTAGASHLFSLEFDQLVRDHLQPGGIFLQWMDSSFIDIELMRSMGATLLNVFPHVRLYEPHSGVFLFVASDQPIRPETQQVIRNGQTRCQVNDSDRPLFQRLGVVTPTHLFAKLKVDEATLRDLSGDAPVITDERNLLAMRAPTVMGRDTAAEIERFLVDRLPVSKDRDAITKLCPSFDAKSYLLNEIPNDNAAWIRQTTMSLIDNESDRLTIEAKLLRTSDDPGDWMRQLYLLFKEDPTNSDLAFELISNRLIGGQIDLTTQQQAEVRQALSPKHRFVIELLEKLIAGDWMASRAKDNELANWSVDDVAYPIAVRLRIPWRLESPMAEQRFRCEEAIAIIDGAAAFANSDGLAYFRVAAAIKANRPWIALATIAELARVIAKSMETENAASLAAGASNLYRCYSVLQDPTLFQSVPAARYREVVSEVRSVLAQLSGGGVPPNG